MHRTIGELLDKLNQRPLSKSAKARAWSLFQHLHRPALRPLPVQRFDLAEWHKPRSTSTITSILIRAFTVRPFSLARQTVEARATPTTVEEIFYHGKRVATHMRTAKPYVAVSHARASARCAPWSISDWPPSRLVQWAATVGTRMQEVAEKIS